MILTLSLALHCFSLTVAFLHYDQERYQYEDSLIRADLMQEVRALPLNYRLPLLPTSAPTFQSPSESNLTAVVGSTVVLACRVTSLGSSSVSWLRFPQLTVLTSGPYVFSSSSRVSLVHSPGSPDYNLQISKVKSSDQGQYRCQINTRPATSILVSLAVRQPGQGPMVPALALRGHTVTSPTRTEILAPDLVTDTEGGTVTLECVVTEHDNPPTKFTWYILGSPLDFSRHRGGILLHNEKKIRSSSSKLTITKLQVSDSGEYTCAPHGVHNKTVYLQIKQIEQRRSFNIAIESGAVSVSVAGHFWKLLAWITVIRFL